MRHRQSIALVLALASMTLSLVGCGSPKAMPTEVALGSSAPVPSRPLDPSYLAPLPTQEAPTALQGTAADFGDSAIVPAQAGTLQGDLEAPSTAVAEGADFALNRADAVRNQIIVQVKPSAAYRVASYTNDAGARVVQSIEMNDRFQVITLPAGMTAEEGMAKYSKQEGVVAAMPNRIYGVTMEPNDPYYEKGWAEDKVKAPTAWDQGILASNVTVAILDTGIDYRHPDLQGRVLVGWNFADNNNDVMDRFGHGTHVAGIIGASGNNGIGVAGIAWTAKLLAIKVLSDSGQGSTAAVLNGIKYAADNGAKIINMSLGSPDTTIDPALSTAIAYARAKGCLVICAAGNNHGQVGSPANDPGAIAVSSTSKFLLWEYMSSFSNRGNKIEVAAPGAGIWSTVPLDPNRTGSTMYGKLSGTSMAAPMVSGEAALIWGKHPDWTADQVRYVIDTAVDHKGSSGRNSHYGFGRINLAKALAM